MIDKATEELHAAITTKGMLEAKIWRAIVSGSSDEAIAADIAAKALLEKEISRRVIEQTTARMAMNLSSVMDLFDVEGRFGKIEALLAELKEVAAHRDGENTRRFDQATRAQEQTYQAVRQLSTRLERLERSIADVNRRIDGVEVLAHESVSDRKLLHAEIEIVRQELHQLANDMTSYIAQLPPDERAELARLVRELVERVEQLERRIAAIEAAHRDGES